MGGNPFRFLFLYIDFKIFFFLLLVLNFFSSSHDLLRLAKLVFDQFNPF